LVVVLESVFFEAVLLEAEGLVEAEGGLVGADYGEGAGVGGGELADLDFGWLHIY